MPPAPDAYPCSIPRPHDDHGQAAQPNGADSSSESSPEPQGSADWPEERGSTNPEADAASTADAAVTDARNNSDAPNDADGADDSDAAAPAAQVRVVEGSGGWAFVERSGEAHRRHVPDSPSSDDEVESAAAGEARP